MWGKSSENWIEEIIEKGKKLCLDLISLIKLARETFSNVNKMQEEFSKEAIHLYEILLLVSKMNSLDSHTLVSKEVLA